MAVYKGLIDSLGMRIGDRSKGSEEIAVAQQALSNVSVVDTRRPQDLEIPALFRRDLLEGRPVIEITAVSRLHRAPPLSDGRGVRRKVRVPTHRSDEILLAEFVKAC
eukprot:CAMPEP_0180645854 /NCGR_PEP_ID=MMETSP1037_2-20121125/49241_1 /TAXON_ID=632150 /ORGANISM="Azadinium spinosum, Strain 3D9" /LENGTH=106 /DNA_ID=CAMNT_0022669799 /DNA_START=160 /DNA_END=480 /DNA_ORIENTATION=-